MPRDRGVLVGRTAEIAALDAFAGSQALLLVRGRGGIGKTAVLRELGRMWRDRGITVLAVPVGNAPAWDLFCAQPVIDVIRQSYDELAGARALNALAAVDRLCDEECCGSARSRAILFAELVRLYGQLRANGPVAVLVDDVHTAPNAVLAVAAAYRAGCTVVASCREDGSDEPTALSGLADWVLDLRPLAAPDVDLLLNQTARGTLDEAVAPAVRAALGPLAGNAGAVLATFDLLAQEDRLVDVLGHLCLRGSEAGAIALPPGHELVERLTATGEVGDRLFAVIGHATRFTIDDLLFFADAFGYDLGTCGAVVDQLVSAGVLADDQDGVLSVPCEALRTALVRRRAAGEVEGLYATIAEHLLRSGAAESSTLADYVALAGAALAVDHSLVPMLDREAKRVLRADPARAARRYRAALRHCPSGSVDRDRLMTTVLHLLVRVGHYRYLGEVVEEVVRAGVEDRFRHELAAAAALAAVHTGCPVSCEVYDSLARDVHSRAPLEFAARWFRGRTPVRTSDLAAAFGGFRVDHLFGAETARAGAIELADDQYDVGTMFKLVLDFGYGEPEHGPLAIYGRLVRNYLDGLWSEVLIDARRLELTGPPHTTVHEVSRLLAAEVMSTFGDFACASQWLGLAGEDGPFPAMRTWVGVGIAYRSGEWEAAMEQGWAAYEQISHAADEGDNVGLRWYLVRLAFLEERSGHAEQLARLCAEAKRWHTRFGGSGLLAAELILRGLSEHDYAAATTAVELLREQGNLAELMRACMTVAFFCDEPGPWYREALEISRQIGEGWMGAHIRESMRKIGVAPPRVRAARDDFSQTELEIIELVRHGMTNRQIATSVRISEKTVENYLTRLFAKTGCRSRLDLATASIEGRLVLAGRDD
ncbi:helix-turn-helix transcriptional regulator [Lentzea kentuckyensis]|uniref:helix-turn-helix transcriptional regulator n=1 Tax=Lentzea kentuckyensis TaxID=360086 RepID=UPI000A36500C|nr:LuxR family transcriptional regulator [Lentzea kentuckyensis]